MKIIQVGKTYMTRSGKSVTITRVRHSLEFPYAGICEEINSVSELSFTACGHIYSWTTDELDLIIQDEPEVQPPKKPEVKHLDVILAIVQKIPVQYDCMLTGTWHDYNYTSDYQSPVNYPEYNWRIKPKLEPKRTIQIGKRTVVAPEVEKPEVDDLYWITGWSNSVPWDNDCADNEHLAEGRVFLTKQDADNCQEAIIALLLGKD